MSQRGIGRALGRSVAAQLVWTCGLAAFSLMGVASPCAQAQYIDSAMSAPVAAVKESSSLPDAPAPAVAASSELVKATSAAAQKQDAPLHRKIAGPFDKFVEEGEMAPQLTAGDKVMIGLRGSVSPYAVIGWITSATYSEAIDGSPYYGQDGKDYLQRLGAAAARATSEDIFTNSVMASVLHEDPRYYQLGRGHRFVSRLGYSLSRVVVTKTDTGAQTVNFAVLTGNLAGSALTQAYYPPSSRGFDGVMKTFGTSLLGQAVGDLFQEFILSSAEFLQLKRKVPVL